MPPSLDCTDFDFSLGEEVAFGCCTPQLESSMLAQMPPAQMPLQHPPSPEPCWRDLADQNQKALGDALEANSQVGTLACMRWASSFSHPAEVLHSPGVQHLPASGWWGCPNHPVLTCPWQLQETLTQRQEELVTLQESNVQLKELASQARQLAAVLDVSAACTTSGLAAPGHSWTLGTVRWGQGAG